jgi:hypothetical protein
MSSSQHQGSASPRELVRGANTSTEIGEQVDMNTYTPPRGHPERRSNELPYVCAAIMSRAYLAVPMCSQSPLLKHTGYPDTDIRAERVFVQDKILDGQIMKRRRAKSVPSRYSRVALSNEPTLF